MIDKDDPFEIVYRRMSDTEARHTLQQGGLVNGDARFQRGGITHTSSPIKWVATSPKRVLSHLPRDSGPEDYSHLVEFFVVPGTREALIDLRKTGNIPRSGTGGYGIPFDLVQWFNNRVLAVQTHNLNDDLNLTNTRTRLQYLMKDDSFVVFQAYSPEFLDNDRFSARMNLNRTTWLKTSLLWTLWRSDWGKKDGQTVIIEVKVPPEYLSILEQTAISAGNLARAKQSDVIYQNDPDRVILGIMWGHNQDYWLRANTTRHFGLRRSAIEEYVHAVAPGNVKDITDIIGDIYARRPQHPTKELYIELGYRKVPSSLLRELASKPLLT